MASIRERIEKELMGNLHNSLKTLELAHAELIKQPSLNRQKILQNKYERENVTRRLIIYYEDHPDRVFPSIPVGYYELPKGYFKFVGEGETVFGMDFGHFSEKAVKKFSDDEYIYEAGPLEVTPMAFASDFCSVRIYKKIPKKNTENI